MNQRPLLNHPFAALVSRIAAAGLSFVLGVFLARTYTVEEFGLLNVMLAASNVGIVLALSGHEVFSTRSTARFTYHNTNNASFGKERIVWNLRVILFSIFSICLIFLSYLAFDSNQTFLWLPFLLLIPLVSLTRVSQSVIRGVHFSSISIIPDGVLRPILSIGVVLIVGRWGTENVFVAAWAFCVAACVALIFSCFLEKFLVKKCGLNSSAEQIRFSDLVAGFPVSLFLSSILSVLTTQLPILAAGFFLDKSAVGLYGAAEKISLAAALIGQSVYLAVSSRLSVAYASGKLDEFVSIAVKSTRFVTFWTFAICFVIYFFSDLIMSVYGSAYVEGATTLRVLLAVTLLNAVCGPTGVVLMMSDNERSHFTSMILSIGIQVVSYFIFVPFFGVEGIAVTSVLSCLVWNVLMMYFIRKNVRIPPVFIMNIRSNKVGKRRELE